MNRSGETLNMDRAGSNSLGAGGAPTNAQFLTLAANATLTNERVFTPSTGLTVVDAGAGGALTLTVDLSTGKAGGLTATGGTAASENLDLRSTSHATKGLTRIGGTTGLVYDETNKRLGIGVSPPTSDVHISSAASVLAYFRSTAAAGNSDIRIESPANTLDLLAYGASATGATWFGAARASNLFLLAAGAGSALGIGTSGSGDIVFGTNNLERMKILNAVGLQMSSRLEAKQGANVASASSMTLGADGNYFKITGTTTIATIVATNWQAGSEITIQAVTGFTLTHGTGNLKLFQELDLALASDDMVKLVWDGTWWWQSAREISFTPP